MNKSLWKVTLCFVLAGGLLLTLTSACTKTAPTPTATPTVAPHPSVDAHAKPKRLEAVIEIDMREFSFDSPQGAKNPTFRLPAGKTVGIHIHNEGAVTHELALGRKRDASTGEYAELLTEMVPWDLFSYYGKEKAEVEGASFGELEIGPGIRDFWLRFNVPANLKGEWEIGCLIKEDGGKDHYAEGMKAKLIFE